MKPGRAWSLLFLGITLMPIASAGGSASFDIKKIQHVIVIYQENWSYDGLYSQYPSSNGYAFDKAVAQTDSRGNPIRSLPQALIGYGKERGLDARFPKEQGVRFADLNPDPNGTRTGGDPNSRLDVRVDTATGDLVHRFYTEQLQMHDDPGSKTQECRARWSEKCGRDWRMDRFAAWSDNPGLVLGAFDATRLPEGELARDYVMCDNSFHSAFGGSFLNHMYFITCRAPVWARALAPLPAEELLKTSGAPDFVRESMKGSTLPLLRASIYPPLLMDGTNWPEPLKNAGGQKRIDFDLELTSSPDPSSDGSAYFAVNTVQPSAWPFDARGPFLPLQKDATIGDLLTRANVSWKWYAGGWDQAVAGNPDPLFQFHHQPFNYFSSFAPGRPGRNHLVDLNQFTADLAAGNLPSVAFVKFLGEVNEHPGYSELRAGQQAAADLVRLIMRSPQWKDSMIVITYDENGGRWDHVPPPSGDEWGPGTRVPMIVISPFAEHAGRSCVDSTQYETVSILRFIERRWGLDSLGERDRKANDLTGAFRPASELKCSGR